MDGEGQEVRSSPFLIESEIKHGRLAMLAAVGYPGAELLHPFIADTANLPSLLTEAGAAPNFLNGGLEALVAKFNLTLVFVVVAMLGRVYNIEIDALQSRNNFLSSDPKEQFPYDLGFDPLGLYAKNTVHTMSERACVQSRVHATACEQMLMPRAALKFIRLCNTACTAQDHGGKGAQQRPPRNGCRCPLPLDRVCIEAAPPPAHPRQRGINMRGLKQDQQLNLSPYE